MLIFSLINTQCVRLIIKSFSIVFPRRASFTRIFPKSQRNLLLKIEIIYLLCIIKNFTKNGLLLKVWRFGDFLLQYPQKDARRSGKQSPPWYKLSVYQIQHRVYLNTRVNFQFLRENISRNLHKLNFYPIDTRIRKYTSRISRSTKN